MLAPGKLLAWHLAAGGWHALAPPQVHGAAARGDRHRLGLRAGCGLQQQGAPRRPAPGCRLLWHRVDRPSSTRGNSCAGRHRAVWPKVPGPPPALPTLGRHRQPGVWCASEVSSTQQPKNGKNEDHVFRGRQAHEGGLLETRDCTTYPAPVQDAVVVDGFLRAAGSGALRLYGEAVSMCCAPMMIWLRGHPDRWAATLSAGCTSPSIYRPCPGCPTHLGPAASSPHHAHTRRSCSPLPKPGGATAVCRCCLRCSTA